VVEQNDFSADSDVKPMKNINKSNNKSSIELEKEVKIPGKILVVGAAVLDRIFYVDHLPAPGETAVGDRMEVFAGGKGANQAFAARKMGAEVRFLSGVGLDEAAGIVLNSLVKARVDTSGVEHFEEAPTAEAVITVDNRGENQITACPGAYHLFKPEHLEKHKEAFQWADWLLIQNELPRPTVDKAMELAREYGLKTIFNPAPFRPHTPPPPLNLNFIVPNEIEAAGLLSVEDYFSVTPAQRPALWRFLEAKNVVVTLGRNGCEWFDEKIQRREYRPLELKAVDTVGAGDTFCGIFAALLAEGKDTDTAIRVAIVGSGLSVTRRGAQTGMPTRDELADYISDNINS